MQNNNKFRFFNTGFRLFRDLKIFLVALKVLKTLTFDQVATHGEERRMEKFINTELLWSTFTTANGS